MAIYYDGEGEFKLRNPSQCNTFDSIKKVVESINSSGFEIWGGSICSMNGLYKNINDILSIRFNNWNISNCGDSFKELAKHVDGEFIIYGEYNEAFKLRLQDGRFFIQESTLVFQKEYELDKNNFDVLFDMGKINRRTNKK